MLSSKDKEKPSRLSLGQLSRLQESTQRNADDIFGAIVDPSSSPKPATPVPVPTFRAVTEEPKTDLAPAVAPPSPAPVLQAVPAPAPQPAAVMVPAGGEGGQPSAPIPRPAKRTKAALKGEPCAAHPGESKRENLVSVRFTPEHMEDLEHWAEAERLPLAVMCRDIILKEMHRNRALIQKIREFRQALTKTA